jgi:hypothetical protein
VRWDGQERARCRVTYRPGKDHQCAAIAITAVVAPALLW